MKKLLTLFVASLFAVSAFAGEYPDISIKDLDAAIKSGKVVVIDVNGTKSFTNKGRIPGAIDFQKEGKQLADKLPTDKETLVVAYCGGPRCKAYKRGASAAEKLGYKNVKHLSAGISGWVKAGMKVEK
jgi:rhodanese-related sulfurtransferase